MILVPCGSKGMLDRLACRIWCKIHIGPMGPNFWFDAEPIDDGFGQDGALYDLFKTTNTLYNIVFYHEADAVAFKLVFGL